MREIKCTCDYRWSLKLISEMQGLKGHKIRG